MSPIPSPESPSVDKVVRAYERALEEIFGVMKAVAAGGKDTTPERAAELVRKVDRANELLGPALARIVERKTMQKWRAIHRVEPLSGEPDDVPF